MNQKFSKSFLTFLFLFFIASAFYSCLKTNQKPLDDTPNTARPIETSLGKTTLNAIVDSMQFGAGLDGYPAYLFVRDTANDSVLRIEINYHQDDKASICYIDSGYLVGSQATIGWNNWETADSPYLRVNYPNNRLLTIDFDSSWEDVYALGVKKVNAFITPNTSIIFTAYGGDDSKQYVQTDTASQRKSLEAINRYFLNTFGQPNYDQYFGQNIKLYSTAWTYILRPRDWHK